MVILQADKKGVPASEYGLVFGVFELIVFIVCPIYGKYMGRIGNKRLLNFGLLTTGTAVISFGFLDKIEGHYPFIIMSFVIRIIEAIGSSAYFTTSGATLTNEFPENVSIIFAIMKIFFGVGFIIGPCIGGLLHEVGGYTLPFVVLGLNLYLAAIMVTILIPEDKKIKKASNSGKFKKMLAIPGVTMAALSLITASASIGFLQVLLQPHLNAQFAMRPIHVGFMFVIGGSFYALSAPFWGWVCDKRQNSKIVAIIGGILLAVGFALIGPAPFLSTKAKLWMVIVGLIFYGWGIGAKLVAAFSNALKYSVSHGFPNDMETYGLVSGIWNSGFAFGAFVGPSLAGVLYDHLKMRYSCLIVILVNLIMAVSSLIFVMCCDSSQIHPNEVNVEESVYPFMTNSMNSIPRRGNGSIIASLSEAPEKSETSPDSALIQNKIMPTSSETSSQLNGYGSTEKTSLLSGDGTNES
ncbi:hypothetical protein QAD02_004936 [Eretmocerus hayati]|uniref:Uncharacterized protein n=1 Tax=Eretmocerus hayati TaxID=131215 RepID=A0ACC2NQZ1_9HYME|nr:hypothetical protein QAD02_004936 [Eretmocerus hayati]